MYHRANWANLDNYKDFFQIGDHLTKVLIERLRLQKLLKSPSINLLNDRQKPLELEEYL